MADDLDDDLESDDDYADGVDVDDTVDVDSLDVHGGDDDDDDDDVVEPEEAAGESKAVDEDEDDENADDAEKDGEEEDDVVVDEEEEEEEDESVQSLDVLLIPDVPAGRTRRQSTPAVEAADRIREGEFTCRSCFLVKKRAQLADPEGLICLDCA